jgi:hypothetical protein
MNQRDRTHVDLAMHDPSGVYASPMDVVDDDGLDPADKQRILVAWHWDMLMLPDVEVPLRSRRERAGFREVKLALAALACRCNAS